jgi:flagellar biosynthesis component FlhA
MTSKKPMLVWGRVNPSAMSDDYLGVYLNHRDMEDMIQQIDEAKSKGEKIPVLMEHVGEKVGNVVSAWIHQNTLQCCLEIENKTLESAIGQEMVRQGVTKELSLGYHLEIQQSNDGRSRKAKKFLKEISLVKRGARHDCHILGVTSTS